MKALNIIVLTLFTLGFGPGQAAADGGIELNMTVQEEITTLNSHGEKVVSLVEPTSIIPGDIIVYTTRFHNTAKMAADNVAIINPIPKDTAYVNGSAEDTNASVSYSVDGGKKFDLPENLFITASNGAKRSATANDYSHIRWILKSVAPDSRGSVSFHAKVR